MLRVCNHCGRSFPALEVRIIGNNFICKECFERVLASFIISSYPKKVILLEGEEDVERIRKDSSRGN